MLNHNSWNSFCRFLEQEYENARTQRPGRHFVDFWSQVQKMLQATLRSSFRRFLDAKPENVKIDAKWSNWNYWNSFWRVLGPKLENCEKPHLRSAKRMRWPEITSNYTSQACPEIDHKSGCRDANGITANVIDRYIVGMRTENVISRCVYALGHAWFVRVTFVMLLTLSSFEISLWTCFPNSE